MRFAVLPQTGHRLAVDWMKHHFLTGWAFMGLLSLSLFLLLLLLLSQLGGSLPEFAVPLQPSLGTLPSETAQEDTESPLTPLREFYQFHLSPSAPPEPDHSPLFFTRYFDPPPPQPKPPPPPPPTSKQVTVRFQGVILSSNSPSRALIQIDQNPVTFFTNGQPLLPPWTLSAMNESSIQITNTQGITNTIPFKQSRPVEIPLP